MKIWTVGHSTHTIEQFLWLLDLHEIRVIADVRSYPSSRHCPQYNANALDLTLERVGIRYVHIANLGGRRRAKPDSPNTTWQHPSFRGYADHMETPEFQGGILQLEMLAKNLRTAFMCAEAPWWKCHRSMISDYLLSQRYEVLHIMADGQLRAHSYTEPARIENGRLTYHAQQPHDRQLRLF